MKNRRKFLRLDGLYLVRWQVIWAVLTVLMLVLGGCGQVDSESVLNSDGTWTKTVTVKIGKQGEGLGGEKVDVTKMVLGKGSGWKGERKDTESDEIYVITKSFEAGESAEMEIQQKGVGMVKSVGTWKSGGFEEVWTWVGKPMDKELGEGRERVGDALKSVSDGMEEGVREAVAKKVASRMWREIYGPGRPLLAMVLHPQVMAREFKMRLYRLLVEELKSAGVGEPEKIAKAVAKLASAEDMGINPTPPSDQEGDSDDGGLISINVVVRHESGAIEDTNGDLNPVDDTAEWSFFPQSAAVGPLELTARFK